MKPKKQKIIFKDDSKRAEMRFPNETYIAVNYKYMTEETIIFHYDLQTVVGTMKIRPKWMKEYDDVLGQAECGLPYLFLPTIFNYLYTDNVDRKIHHEKIIDLYNQKKFKEIEDINWSSYHGIKTNKNIIKEIKKPSNLKIKL
jgi:hypothetical protein